MVPNFSNCTLENEANAIGELTRVKYKADFLRAYVYMRTVLGTFQSDRRTGVM